MTAEWSFSIGRLLSLSIHCQTRYCWCIKSNDCSIFIDCALHCLDTVDNFFIYSRLNFLNLDTAVTGTMSRTPPKIRFLTYFPNAGPFFACLDPGTVGRIYLTLPGTHYRHLCNDVVGSYLLSGGCNTSYRYPAPSKVWCYVLCVEIKFFYKSFYFRVACFL